MSNYSKGANFERRVQRYLEKQGWVVLKGEDYRERIARKRRE